MAPKAKAAAAKATPAPKPKAKVEKKEKKDEEPRPEDLIPKVAQPNAQEFEDRIEAVNKEIDGLQKKQQDLSTRINERSHGKDDYMKKRNELRVELDKWSRLIDELKAEKDEIAKQMGDKRQEGIDMKNQLQKMKKTIGYKSETEIDDRIASIEFKMWTGTISLKEEKDLMKELAELKRNRPKVSHVNKLETDLKDGGDRGLPLKERRAAINERQSQYFEEKKKISEELKALNEERSKTTGDLPDLIAKKEELGKQIGEKIKERNQIKGEKRQAEQEYYKYQAEIRKIKAERYAEEKKLREKEWQVQKLQREADKLDEQPYVAEITLIEQSILFCKNLMTPKASEKKEEKADVKYDNPADTVVLKKKGDLEDEEFFVAPTKGKKSKSKGAKTESGTAAKPIKHNAETFNLFSKLKLDAPVSTADVPELLEKLEAQLQDYHAKVKNWEEKRDEMKRKILEGGSLDEEEKEEKEEKAEAEKPEEKEEEA